MEGQLALLEKEAEEYATDYQRLMEIDEKKEALNTELLGLYERWEELGA